jgi:membrane fusion protein (multidrug efflux system)
MKRIILLVGWACLSSLTLAAAPVELVSIQKRDLKITTTQPISVEAFHTADIGARVTGYVEAVLADIGTPVQAGQPLFKISAPDQEAKVAVFEAETIQRAAAIAAAQAELKAVESEQRRTQALVDKGSVTVKAAAEALHRLEQARAALLSVEAALAVSKARQAEAQQMLDFAVVAAPFDGLVAARFVDPGDLVIADAKVTLFQVVAVNRLRIVAYIPEREAVWLNNGDPAILSFDAYPGQSFQASVTRTAGVLDSKTRRMRTEIDLDNSKGLLFAGMYGQTQIELQNRRNALVLPAGAVRFNDGPAHVYAVENGVVKRIPVQLGIDTGPQIEIVVGLTGSEQIVANSIGRLRDGDAVTIQNRK